MKKIITIAITLVMLALSMSVMAEENKIGSKVEVSPFTVTYQFYTKDDYQDGTNGLFGIKYNIPINKCPIDIETGVLGTVKKPGDNALIVPVYASYKRYFNEEQKWFFNIAPGLHFYTKGDDKIKFGTKFGVGCKIDEKSAINVGFVAYFEDGNPTTIELGYSF